MAEVSIGFFRLTVPGRIPYSKEIVVGNGFPQGWGRSFGKGFGALWYSGEGVGQMWFHAPIPTFTVMSSVRVLLEDVFIFFQTNGDCFMSHLDVWDGPNLINKFPSLHISGDHRVDPVPGENAFQVRDAGTGAIHTMNFGLNLSMSIDFKSGSSITFSSAGASFITSD